jgi:hypothetical protein
VEFPAPRGTPLISPHIKWDHSQTWDVPASEDFPNGSSSSSATVYTIGELGTLVGGFLLPGLQASAEAYSCLQMPAPSLLTTTWWTTASMAVSSSLPLATFAWCGGHWLVPWVWPWSRHL